MNREAAWTTEAALGELLLTRQMQAAADLQAIVDAKRASPAHRDFLRHRRAALRGMGR